VCQSYERRFDDAADTIFAGHHQPLWVWILCLDCLGSIYQTTRVSTNSSSIKKMCSRGRVRYEGIVHKKPIPTFTDEVACDKVYIVAGTRGSLVR
jgi:hypothetical protein